MSTVEITSVGALHAPVPGAHIVLDLRRHFRDPHVDPALRTMTGHDEPVQRAVLGTPGIRPLIAATVQQVVAYASGPSGDQPIQVVTVCAGGRHRSAVVADRLGFALQELGLHVTVTHRDIDKPVINR